MKADISVIGGGSWGTALVQLLSGNGHRVAWWVRRYAMASHIKEHGFNPDYHSYAKIAQEQLLISNDLEEIIGASDIILLAIPAAFLHSTLEDKTKGKILSGKTIISAIKGIVPETYQAVAEYLNQYQDVNEADFGLLAGPCHSEEVVMRKLSYITIAFQDEEKARRIASLLRNSFMTVGVSTDIIGTEYAAILKNVYALASGIALGLGYGDNFQAVLVVNAMQEMKRFLNKVTGNSEDMHKTQYSGDLIVTSYSNFSRNRQFGKMLGKGYTVASSITEMKMVAEGYYAARSIYELNRKFKVDMPVNDMVYRVLYDDKQAAAEMKILAGLIN